jgi:hypothetical protein
VLGISRETATAIKITTAALGILVAVIGPAASSCLYFRCLSSNEVERFFSSVRAKMVTFTVAQFAENYGTSALVTLQRSASLIMAGYATPLLAHTNNFNRLPYMYLIYI